MTKQVVNAGKPHDPILASAARNLWLIVAIHNIEFIIVHIQGRSNILADLLSRWSTTINPYHKLQQLLPQYIRIPAQLDLLLLNYS